MEIFTIQDQHLGLIYCGKNSNNIETKTILKHKSIIVSLQQIQTINSRRQFFKSLSLSKWFSIFFPQRCSQLS